MRTRSEIGRPSFWLFVGPALLLYTVFLILPMVVGLGYSFTDYRFGARTVRYVGLTNFVTVLTRDRYFVPSILFTLRLVVVLVIARNLLGVVLAVALSACPRKVQGFLRTVYFSPYMFSVILATFMFYFIFAYVLPQIGARVAALSFLEQSWIGDPRLSFWSILTVHLWHQTPFMMIIYLAAIVGIPQDLKDAAMVDGAGPVARFFRVTVPMIMPAFTICVFLTLRDGFRTFDIVYGMTQGGPARMTEVIALSIYNEGFSTLFRYGVASAKAMVLFLMVLAVTVVQIGAMKRLEVEL